mgnify:CR=1 FL=1
MEPIVLSPSDQLCRADNAVGRGVGFLLPAKTPTRPGRPDNRPNAEVLARPVQRTSDTTSQTVDPEILDSR